MYNRSFATGTFKFFFSEIILVGHTKRPQMANGGRKVSLAIGY